MRRRQSSMSLAPKSPGDRWSEFERRWGSVAHIEENLARSRSSGKKMVRATDRWFEEQASEFGATGDTTIFEPPAMRSVSAAAHSKAARWRPSVHASPISQLWQRLFPGEAPMRDVFAVRGKSDPARRCNSFSRTDACDSAHNARRPGHWAGPHVVAGRPWTGIDERGVPTGESVYFLRPGSGELRLGQYGRNNILGASAVVFTNSLCSSGRLNGNCLPGNRASSKRRKRAFSDSSHHLSGIQSSSITVGPH